MEWRGDELGKIKRVHRADIADRQWVWYLKDLKENHFSPLHSEIHSYFEDGPSMLIIEALGVQNAFNSLINFK